MAYILKAAGCAGGCAGGADPCNPVAPEPSLVGRAVSATRTKCGFPENLGYESTPPKIYLKRTFTGSLVNRTYDSGVSCSGTFVDNQSDYDGYCEWGMDDCAAPITSGLTVDSTPWPCGDPMPTGCADLECVPTQDSTNSYYTADAVCRGATIFLGAAHDALSDEYTTAELIAAVEAALDSFSGSFDSESTSSFRDLSDEETTYSVIRAQYKFVLPTLTGVTCYKITWDEVFHAEAGGSSVLASRSYLWDGIATETDVYDLDEPASADGSITIENIVVSFECS